MKKIFKIAIIALAIVATGAATANAAFTRNLTVGSTGADVAELQSWLISKGFSIPSISSGAATPGYFGQQTKDAVAAYQASVGLPAQGFFGPLTMAKIAGTAGGSVTVTPPGAMVIPFPCPAGYVAPAPWVCPNSTSPSNPAGLSGDEASLEDFDLVSEESSGSEGEENVEIATAEFDVEDGDVRVERLEVDFQAEDTSDSVRPWDFFDTVSIWANGKMIKEMDVDARGDWDENDDDSDHSASTADYYRLTFTGLDLVVRDGETAEITIAATIAGTIDTDDITQEFTVLIPDDGIRATDAAGIQQYVGTDSEVVSGFGFDAEESGDLDLETNSSDPDIMTLISDEDDESEAYSVFVFDIENNDNADSVVTDITVTVATSSGDAIGDILDEAILVVDGDEFDGDINADGTIDFDDIDVEVAGDDEVTFTLKVVLKADAPESTLDFTVSAANVSAEGVDSGDDSDVTGSVSSETHTVSTSGIAVDGVSTSANVDTINGTLATYTIKFTVEALEDNVYIYNGAEDQGFNASTTGMFYNIYKGSTLQTATTTDSATIQSSAEQSGNYFLVEEGETETFTLTVTLTPDTTAAGLFYVELDSIRFDDETAAGTTNDTTHELPNDAEFETNPVSVL
jgi:hypothetical protein